MPLKNYLRVNHSKFIYKKLRKEIKLILKLRNIFLPQKTETTGKNYKKQRNFYVFLLRRAKGICYNNLDLRNLFDSNNFVKPVFASKIKGKNVISLKENSNVIQNELKLTEI